jgi:hypothetical protein
MDESEAFEADTQSTEVVKPGDGRSTTQRVLPRPLP